MARKYLTAWIPVLWGGGGVARAEPEKPAPRTVTPHAAAAHATASARATHRPPLVRHIAPRRPKCPEGYICQYR
jgi:hypothetical protein